MAAQETLKPSPASPPKAQRAAVLVPKPEEPPAPVAVPASLPVRPPPPASPEPAGEKTAGVILLINTTFALYDPKAGQVSLGGDFNGWLPEATPMKRQADGNWKVTLALRPGRYQYKFIVDGQWMPDLNAPENVMNPHGTLNSVVEVRA